MKKRYWILIIVLICLVSVSLVLFTNEDDWKSYNPDALENMPIHKKLNECRADCVGEQNPKTSAELGISTQLLLECDNFCDDFYEIFGEEELNKYIEEIRRK